VFSAITSEKPGVLTSGLILNLPFCTCQTEITHYKHRLTQRSDAKRKEAKSKKENREWQ
jgi:hypothetical protein